MAMPTVRDVHVDTPLSMISVAYGNESYLAEQIFPRIAVQKQTDLYWVFDKASFFRDEVALRAPGTEADEIDYGVTTASYYCPTYAISHVISDEVRRNADNGLQPDVVGTELITDKLLLAQERRVAALTTGGSGLWAYSTTPTVAWTSATSDPWGDIDGMVNGVVSAIGRMPNVFVCSWQVWKALRNHPDFLDRIKYTRPGGRVEQGDLANWFGFAKVLVGAQLYDTAAEGATSTMAYIWGDQSWCGYVTPGPSLMTPSAGYVLEWGSRTISRFRLDTRHADKLEAQHSVDEIIAASSSGAILYNCV